MSAQTLRCDRSKWKPALILVALAIAVVTVVGFVVFRVVRCDYTDDASVPSPDGKWLATATSRACPAGFLSVTNYDAFVTLGAKPSPGVPTAAPVQVFAAEGAADPPKLTWTGTNELRVELKELGNVRVSKHEVASVRINYVVPKWIWDRLGTIEPDRLREDKQSEELFKAGKISEDTLRHSLEASAAVAEERTKFRQWVLDNATVEGVSPQRASSADD